MKPKARPKPEETNEEEEANKEEAEDTEAVKEEKKGTHKTVILTKSRWEKRDEENIKADISNAPSKKTWKRVIVCDTTEKGSEGNEANKEKTAWKSCGSKDTPGEEEPTAPKNRNK